MKITLTYFSVLALTLLLFLGMACETSTQSVAITATPTPATQAAQPSKDDLIPRTKPADAMRLFKAGEALIIDVRDPGSYEQMRVKGALNVTYNDILAGKLDQLPKDKQLILYCTCHKEHTAALAAVVLQEKGYQKVSALLDGLYGYKDAGGEIIAKS